MAVKRAIQAALAVAFLVFAVVALFVGRPEREAENRVDLAPRPSAQPVVREEATLRNVTKKPVEYTILPSPNVRVPRTRTLAVGAVDKLATDLPVEISFDSGRRMMTYLIHPGRPYSFRYDETNVIRVYPGSHGREDAADLAPFVPTPREVVARMLEARARRPGGRGLRPRLRRRPDGHRRRQTRSCRAVGIELDPALLEQCQAAAEEAGVTPAIRTRRGGQLPSFREQ